MAKLARLQTRLDQSDAQVKQLLAQVDSLNNDKQALKEQYDRDLAAKQREMEDSSERYRRYLEKAKFVIKTLGPTSNVLNAEKTAVNQQQASLSSAEMQSLRTQLAEREKRIKELTKENEKLRSSREQEEQLMASAWYSLGMSLNRRTMDERNASFGASFLSQQRHLPTNTTALAHQHHNQSCSFAVTPSPPNSTTNNTSTPSLYVNTMTPSNKRHYK